MPDLELPPGGAPADESRIDRRWALRIASAATLCTGASLLPSKAVAANVPAAIDAGSTFLCADLDTEDTFQTSRRRLDFKDTVGARGSVINIDHRADGTGNTVNVGQTYGFDIHNYPGAKSAIVVHQYSSVERAVTIDNTGAAPAIEINNTRNDVLNPGSDGIGDYLLFRDHGRMALRVDKDLIFRVGSTKVPTFVHTDAKALSVQTAASFNGETMDVTKAGTGPGVVLKVNNSGTGNGLHIRQTGAGRGLQIDANAPANSGQYAALIQGYDYAMSATTVGDGGATLVLTKNGSGSGTVQQIVNKGSGNSLEVRDAKGQRFTVAAGGYISVIQGQNVNLLAGPGSPEGYRDAPVGSIYLRTDGGQSSTLYVKEPGASTNTGWVAK